MAVTRWSQDAWPRRDDDDARAADVGASDRFARQRKVRDQAARTSTQSTVTVLPPCGRLQGWRGSSVASTRAPGPARTRKTSTVASVISSSLLVGGHCRRCPNRRAASRCIPGRTSNGGVLGVGRGRVAEPPRDDLGGLAGDVRLAMGDVRSWGVDVGPGGRAGLFRLVGERLGSEGHGHRDDGGCPQQRPGDVVGSVRRSCCCNPFGHDSQP